MKIKRQFIWLGLLCTLLILIFACAFFNVPNEQRTLILYQLRLPSIITALFCGVVLSSSGLASQSYFQNPLATQDILGISAAASLGAIIYLVVDSFHPLPFFLNIFSTSFIFAFLFSLLLLILSSFIQSILILGLLSSFFFFSLSSIFLQLSNSQIIKMHLFWGFGSFSANSLSQTPFIILSGLILFVSFFLFSKPLNILILGKEKAFYEGVSLQKVKFIFLILISLSVSLNIIWAGPIAFISIVAPHVARVLFQEQNHYTLFPASALIGCIFSLTALFLSKFIASFSIELSINPLLSILSFPILIYLLIGKKFNSHDLS